MVECPIHEEGKKGPVPELALGDPGLYMPILSTHVPSGSNQQRDASWTAPHGLAILVPLPALGLIRPWPVTRKSSSSTPSPAPCTPRHIYADPGLGRQRPLGPGSGWAVRSIGGGGLVGAGPPGVCQWGLFRFA